MPTSQPCRRFSFKSTAELGLLVPRLGRMANFVKESSDVTPLARDFSTNITGQMETRLTMLHGRLCESCGRTANPSLASRRGLSVTVDTRWRVSKDGVARITQSAASGRLSGSSAGSACSRTCSSCASNPSRTAGKTSSAKRAGRGEFDDDYPASFSRQVSTSSSTCPSSASSQAPQELSKDPQALLALWRDSYSSRARQHVQVGFH